MTVNDTFPAVFATVFVICTPFNMVFTPYVLTYAIFVTTVLDDKVNDVVIEPAGTIYGLATRIISRPNAPL